MAFYQTILFSNGVSPQYYMYTVRKLQLTYIIHMLSILSKTQNAITVLGADGKWPGGK